MRLLLASLVVVAVVTAACGGDGSTLAITLVSTGDPPGSVVRVTGLSSRELASLGSAHLTDESWNALLRVTVAGGAPDRPAVAGRYAVTGSGVEFTPRFGFDPGRLYDVRFDPSRLPQPRDGPPVVTTIALAAGVEPPPVTVTRLLPSADVLPENLLRVYLEFSGPMSRGSGRDFVRLLDDQDREVPEALLSIDVDLWNADYTRYTVFFDPGRVKRGIQPNERMGRALRAGRTYTIDVAPRWLDARGRPLAAPFRRSFRAGPAALSALDPAGWRIDAPRAGTRDPLMVTFPSPLDHGLLGRGLGVADTTGRPLEGEAAIGPAETTWRFIPREAWRAGPHDLVAFGFLEDPAGNRIGRPFDLDRLQSPDGDRREGERHTVRFVLK